MQQKGLHFWLSSFVHRHFIILRLSCVLSCSIKCKLPLPAQPVMSRSLVYSVIKPTRQLSKVYRTEHLLHKAVWLYLCREGALMQNSKLCSMNLRCVQEFPDMCKGKIHSQVHTGNKNVWQNYLSQVMKSQRRKKCSTCFEVRYCQAGVHTETVTALSNPYDIIKEYGPAVQKSQC